MSNKIKEPEILSTTTDTKSQIAHILSWYSNEKSKDDAKEYLIEYAEKFCPEYVDHIRRANTNNIIGTHAWIARLMVRGYFMLYEETVNTYLKSLVKNKNIEEKVPRKIVRSEYDLDEFIGSLEEKIDEYITDKKPFDINEEFKKQSVPLKYHSEIKDWANRKIKEFQTEYDTIEVVDGIIPYEVKERIYSSDMKTKHLQRLVVYLTLNDIKKERKVIKKKKVDPSKQVEKVKYLTNWNGFVSVNPVHIIGAKLCVTFNTKYKYIQIYKANVPSGLFVKGSSIYNFDDSIGKKILKKPESNLKNFLGTSKEDLLKAFESINTKPSNLSGQLNEHTLILRVE